MYELIDKVCTKLKNLIKKGYVSRETSSDSGDYLNMQITTLGKITNAQVIFPYGMNAMPPAKTLGLCFSVLGSEDMIYFIPFAMNDRFKNLKTGEVKSGSQKYQNFVYFKEDGSILIESKGKIDIKSSGTIDIKATGDVNIDAPKTNLGVGGKKIALNGDPIVDSKIVASGTNTSI